MMLMSTTTRRQWWGVGGSSGRQWWRIGGAMAFSQCWCRYKRHHHCQCHRDRPRHRHCRCRCRCHCHCHYQCHRYPHQTCQLYCHRLCRRIASSTDTASAPGEVANVSISTLISTLVYQYADEYSVVLVHKYNTLALRGLEEPAHASRGLEEPFFQLCCCVSFWFWCLTLI
jgi:hypothetical protein